MTPTANHDRLATLGAGLAVLFLFVSIAQIGRYNVTIGGVFCAITLIASIRACSPSGAIVLSACGFVFWPILVVLTAWYYDSALLPSIEQFLASGALWTVSVALILLATISRRPIFLGNVFPIVLFLLALMALQFIGAKFFHNHDLYVLVLKLAGVDIAKFYIKLDDMENARAIGMYYEPSMCARVMGTLCFIDMLKTGKILRNGVALLLCALLTQSIGLLLLVIVLAYILFGRSIRSLSRITMVLLAVSILVLPFVLQRFTNEKYSASSSSYTRTIAPISVLAWVIDNYPLGVPIGSAEALALKTGYLAETGEAKVTNGIYEFLFYFGVLGLALVAIALSCVVKLVLVGEAEYAAALAYLILSTGLSGSFLSLESTMLTYFFIVTARQAKFHRMAKRSRHVAAAYRKDGLHSPARWRGLQTRPQI
ncbi:hypothetical protein [Bradyrhizobium sp. 150]|uniref:hypothetical protein n=1 Tax=Bradyrhizobium sp. 150 TaxID=2782625 RepID=UPI001FF81A85|nr:hypothetical protein [Bradyrhizobium sp. 150]MCK1675309.1 hypothetical protein [Bradyrhizobium sp. 150]